MSTEGLVALGGIGLALLTHAVAFFRWAARLDRVLAEHDLRIRYLEQERG